MLFRTAYEPERVPLQRFLPDIEAEAAGPPVQRRMWLQAYFANMRHMLRHFAAAAPACRRLLDCVARDLDTRFPAQKATWSALQATLCDVSRLSDFAVSLNTRGEISGEGTDAPGVTFQKYADQRLTNRLESWVGPGKRLRDLQHTLTELVAGQDPPLGPYPFVGLKESPVWLTPLAGAAKDIVDQARRDGGGQARAALELVGLNPAQGTQYIALVTREPLAKLKAEHPFRAVPCRPVGPTVLEAGQHIYFRHWPTGGELDPFGRTYDLNDARRAAGRITDLPTCAFGVREACTPRLHLSYFSECVLIGEVTDMRTEPLSTYATEFLQDLEAKDLASEIGTVLSLLADPTPR